MKEIDCRGLSYLRIIREIKSYFNSIGEGEAIIKVGDDLERSNVIRFAMHKGYHIEEDDSDCFSIHLEKRGCLEIEEDEKIFSILVTTDKLGIGDEELGCSLMKEYFVALNEFESLPREILFLNSAVKLFDEKLGVLDEINLLYKKGVTILISDMSLDYYKLKDNIRFGEITNMYHMVATMKKAKKLIKL